MQKNIPSRERGSALLVTMMITSVVLLFAMILLERIIPYSKQIRGMQDSVQAYYTAKSQIELARSEFADTRENINTDRIQDGGDGTFSLIPPVLGSANPGDYLIVSESTQLPLQIRLFENDATVRSFGISQKDPSFHILGSSGLLFDLTERNTTSFTMTLDTDPEYTDKEWNISVEFVQNDGANITPFFGNVNTTPGVLAWKDIATTKKNSSNSETLNTLLNNPGCGSSTCSLKLLLTDSETPIIPVKFSLSTAIPDLNAIIVADGISPNETYHRRIIELIPLIQGI